MWLPSIRLEICTSSLRRFDRRFSVQASMSSMPVVIIPERDQFCLQIRRRPEQQLVQTLAADCADESLDKGMRPGNIGNGLDFCNAEDSEVGFRLMKPIQRVVI